MKGVTSQEGCSRSVVEGPMYVFLKTLLFLPVSPVVQIL